MRQTEQWSLLAVLLEYLVVIDVDHHFGAQVYHLCWLQCCHPHPHSSWGDADCDKFYHKYCILIIWCTANHVFSGIIVCNKHIIPSYRIWLACMIRRQGKNTWKAKVMCLNLAACNITVVRAYNNSQSSCRITTVHCKLVKVEKLRVFCRWVGNRKSFWWNNFYGYVRLPCSHTNKYETFPCWTICKFMVYVWPSHIWLGKFTMHYPMEMSLSLQ